jgi:hypothetical protein
MADCEIAGRGFDHFRFRTCLIKKSYSTILLFYYSTSVPSNSGNAQLRCYKCGAFLPIERSRQKNGVLRSSTRRRGGRGSPAEGFSTCSLEPWGRAEPSQTCFLFSGLSYCSHFRLIKAASIALILPYRV